jgi:hypothetical protein
MQSISVQTPTQTPAQKQERLFSEFLSKLSDDQPRSLVEPFVAEDTSKLVETMVSSSERLSELLEQDSGFKAAFQAFIGNFVAISKTRMSAKGLQMVAASNQDPDKHLQDNLIAAIVLRLAKTHHPSKTASLPTPERFLEDNSISLN